MKVYLTTVNLPFFEVQVSKMR